MGTSPSSTPSEAVQRRWAAASGAILLRSPDLDAAAAIVLRHLQGEIGLDDALQSVGVERAAVDMLRDLLPAEQSALENALSLGRAWVLGRQSIPAASGSWSPVVSGIGLDPRSFPRVTGETLIAMIGKATREILVATAYVDRGGITSLLPSLVSASRRGVAIIFAAVRKLERDDALAVLEGEFAARGLNGLTVERLETDDGFPHLKVLVVDGRAAYLGSANITRAGLTSNFEIGALVEGQSGVEAIRSFVLSLIRRRASESGGHDGGIPQ